MPTDTTYFSEDDGGEIEEDIIDLGAFPIDSLMIHTQPRSVFEACRRIESGIFVLNPEFQRDFVWNEERQSKLIESALLRIPLPVFYLAEAKDGKVVVVDGLQRLSTFHRFLNGKFKLKGLSSWPEINGKSFEALPPTLKTRIEDTPLTLYIIDSRVPEEARYEIFARVNSGVPLTRQQMRNCLYTGPATKWLKDMADSDEFQAAISQGLSRESMRDRECINRFAAFKTLGWQNYHGKMDGFLGMTLDNMNRHPEFEQLTNDFLQAMKAARLLFGTNAFRKSMNPSVRRSVINVALFDVMTFEFSQHAWDKIVANKDAIAKAIRELLMVTEFDTAISRSTNSITTVRTRFRMLNQTLRSILT